MKNKIVPTESSNTKGIREKLKLIFSRAWLAWKRDMARAVEIHAQVELAKEEARQKFMRHGYRGFF